MIQTTARKPVPLRVATRAPHVTLGDLCFDRGPSCARSTEVESLDLTGTVVEVKSAVVCPAVNAAVFALEGIKPVAALPDVAIDVNLVSSRIRAVARCLALLVSLPRFGRVVGFAACHALSLLDYWGDESLGTAEMAA